MMGVEENEDLNVLLEQERQARQDLERQLAELKNAPAELGETGLKALQKEREAKKELERQLAELKGKAQAGDVLANELQLTKQQLQARIAATEKAESELKAQIEERDRRLQDFQIENQFTKAAASISLNSKYVSTLLKAHRSDFKLADDGSIVSANGLTLEQWLVETRNVYPELFNAPAMAGSGATPSRDRNGKAKVINRQDAQGFLSNLDGIIEGTILTE
jgi:flagellar hook-basal body complex protein FliE